MLGNARECAETCGKAERASTAATAAQPPLLHATFCPLAAPAPLSLRQSSHSSARAFSAVQHTVWPFLYQLWKLVHGWNQELLWTDFCFKHCFLYFMGFISRTKLILLATCRNKNKDATQNCISNIYVSVQKKHWILAQTTKNTWAIRVLRVCESSMLTAKRSETIGNGRKMFQAYS